MPLTSARLANIRTRATAYMGDTGVIEYPTHTADSEGGWLDAWTARGTVNGYLEAQSTPSGEMVDQGGRLEVYTLYSWHIAFNQTIEAADRVTIDSRLYRVESVIEPETWKATKVVKLTLEDVQ